MLHAHAITIDIDWAPDFVIEFTAELLVEKRLSATWFITHASPAITYLRKYPDFFELGIHPNFFPGSSQGSAIGEIIANCLETVPEAQSVRTHGLFQSSALLIQMMQQTGLKVDSSIFLPHANNVQPVIFQHQEHSICRLPYIWEDDYEMGLDHPEWDLPPFLLQRTGLQIFNFHPIHLFLNDLTPNAYEKLKKVSPSLSEASPFQTQRLRRTGIGPLSAFKGLIDFLSSAGQCTRLLDIINKYNSNNTSLGGAPNGSN